MSTDIAVMKNKLLVNNSYNFLLIEDNLDHVELFRANLEMTSYAGVRLEQSSSYKKAIHLLQAETFDLIFIDLSLKDSNIQETLERLKELSPFCPVIVITSLDDRDTINNIIKQGADDCLPKSEMKDTILERVIHFNIERWQLKQRIKGQEETYSNMYHGSPIMHFSVDAKSGKTIKLNQQFLDRTGFSEDEIIGKEIINIYDPSCIDVAKKAFQSFLTNGCTYNVELKIKCKDKSVLDVLLNCSAVRDIDGEILHTNSTFIDMTETKHAIESVRLRDHAFAMLDKGIVITDPNQHDNPIVYVNKAVEKISGYKEAELIGFNPRIFANDDRDQKSELDEIRNALKEERTCHVVLRNYHKDGRQYWNDLVISPVFDEKGNLLNYISTQTDVTERKRIEEEVLLLTRAVENSASGILISNLDGIVEYANSSYQVMAGYRKEEIVGQHLDVFRSGKTPASVYEKGWESLHAGNDWRGDLSNRRKDGSDYWVRASVTGTKGLSGEISHFVGVYEDITQEYVMTEKLNHLATHDVLTKLINRYEFERRAERLLESSLNNDGMHALCYIDLDQFKIINDTCGHLAGDELLRQISSVLKGKVRVRDTLARLGGDEFGVLMEHCTLVQAERVAETLLEVVDEFEFVWEGRSFRIGMSIGLVEIDSATLNLTELFKRADSACYMAKDLGRNRVHTYHLDDIDIAERSGQMQWATKIQQALENDSFTLFAQAIEPLNGGLEKHYELLVRMIGSEGKIIPPGAFLPAAERYNLISRIDRWVISTAFKLMFENPAFVEQIDFISINLSGESLADNKFNEFVTMLLETGMVSGDKICFEITETAAITNLNMANIFIDEMKAFGCRFALDDFGSGLSSFGYLKKLPVDYLKIDGMFVKDIIDDPIDLAMVKSINEVGHIMGMKTIAEFVENDEIKASLNIIRVDYGQGYGIHKPISFDELIASSNII